MLHKSACPLRPNHGRLAPAPPEFSSVSCNVLTIEDLQCLLQGLDLLLPALHPLLVGDAGVHARRLELLVVGLVASGSSKLFIPPSGREAR